MSNRTYICTICRIARRAPAAYGLVTGLRCRECSGPLWELSRKWRIPKLADAKGWAELHGMVERSRPQREIENRHRGERLIEEIERKLHLYSLRKPTAHRDSQMRKLVRQRDLVQRSYLGIEARHDLPSDGIGG
ncbi:hypothetical protein OKA04_09525 [Luteolibacter flavescens]|uniref:Uncharacterized protein n=1 Tax=Luteolibacter flavescens TaxID=1859460 RepID=A0ABT3FPQ1_9BACT|nr:hypothetical protein [Luteolibacter flavescens]MCW1884965.1 hypothetical protein [Luteolibacter flavescens]